MVAALVLVVIYLALRLQQQSLLWQQRMQSLLHEKQMLSDDLDKADLELDKLKLESIHLREQVARLMTRMEERQRFHVEQMKTLQQSKEVLKQEFQGLAHDIFTEKGHAFRQLNQQHLEQFFHPFSADLKGFKDKVERIHVEDLKQRSELKAELLHLQRLNRDITDQAAQLTSALQGQKKQQGSWGELLLENALERAGLQAGKDFQREKFFVTQEGGRRPDVVIYLPDHKHLVIDAKTSLSAYLRYVNADSSVDKDVALRAHVRAMGQRIQELSDKRYFSLPGLASPEIVVMFVPLESAYAAAMQAEPELFQRAIDAQVLIATPTTLLASLNLIRQLWRYEDQSQHAAELAQRAERFYQKLRVFVETLQDVGLHMDKSREAYDKAFAQLYTGKGNLIRQAADFKELGVSVKQELSAELLEKARRYDP